MRTRLDRFEGWTRLYTSGTCLSSLLNETACVFHVRCAAESPRGPCRPSDKSTDSNNVRTCIRYATGCKNKKRPQRLQSAGKTLADMMLQSTGERRWN